MGTRVEEGRPLPRARGETVLIVEDDPVVRLLVLQILKELDYTTIEAHDSASALPVLASTQRIDLLMSDVGLPGMDGRQLADIAREHRPGLRILFMTAYASNATHRREFLGEGMEMIMKPFTVAALAEKVREILQ